MPDYQGQPVDSSLYQPDAGGQMPEAQNIQPEAGSLNSPDASGQRPDANTGEQMPPDASSQVPGANAEGQKPSVDGVTPNQQEMPATNDTNESVARGLEDTVGMPISNEQDTDKGSLPPIGPPLGDTNENDPQNVPMPEVVTPEQAPANGVQPPQTEVPPPAETPVSAPDEVPALPTESASEEQPAPGMPPPPTEENPMPAPEEPGVNVPVTESNPPSAPEETGANNEQGEKTDIEILATKLDEWEKELDEKYNGFKDTYAQVKKEIAKLLEERGQSNK